MDINLEGFDRNIREQNDLEIDMCIKDLLVKKI